MRSGTDVGQEGEHDGFVPKLSCEAKLRTLNLAVLPTVSSGAVVLIFSFYSTLFGLLLFLFLKHIIMRHGHKT